MLLSSRCRYSFQSGFSFLLNNFQHRLLYSTKSPNQSGLYFVHNNFQHCLLYSTKSPNQSNNSPTNHHIYSDYFVNNLGFSPRQALSTSTKLRFKYGHYSKFCDNANSVLHLLKQRGFADTHIKNIVFSFPRILSFNIDKTLKPKLKLLEDHGLLSVILTNPTCLDIDTIIMNDIKEILGSDENMMKFFKTSNFRMSPSGLLNIALLKNEYGVDIKLIRKLLLNRSRSYLRNPDCFRNILIRVEEELGIPRSSGMFLYGVSLLCCYSKENIDSKCELLKSFGWSEYDVSELMRRQPNAFEISEENMREKLGFLMTKLGYKPDFLITRAVLLSLSLEKRLVPRHRVLLVLKEKGLLDYNFYSASLKSEKQFLQLLEPFKEAVPGLLELYHSNKGWSNINTISK